MHAKVVQVSNVAIGSSGRKGERVAPEVPLEDDDSVGSSDDPYEVKGTFAA